MLPLIYGTHALQHARVVGYASQRVAGVIDRIAGGTRVAGHEDCKPGHTAALRGGFALHTYFDLSTRSYSTHDACAQPKQIPTHVLRRREGWSVHSPAGARFDRVVNTTEHLVLQPTEEERKLASQLKFAGGRQPEQWHKLYAEYSGSSPIVLTAAMHAALKQRDYEEGYKIYKRFRHMTLPTYTIAMKLLGKLGHQDEVERLWGQLVERDIVSCPQASGRIDAAADSGDIQAAARVLRYLREKGLQADEVHFNSAINSCANSRDSNRAKAAQSFLDEMLSIGMKPNIVTYTNLFRAFRQEPRQRLLNLLVEMNKENVKANRVFAETYLFVFLRQPEKGSWTTVNVIASDLRKRPLADLQVAKEVIDELRDSGVHLSRSCETIDAAIRRVQEEARRLRM